MLNKLKNQQIISIFAIIVVIDLFSLVSHSIEFVGVIGFVILLAIFSIITYKNLYYGLIMLLTELTIGSFGYLYSIQINNFKLSVRLAFFIVFFIIWAIKYLRFKPLINNYKSCAITRWLYVFFILFTFGLLTGVLNGNALSLIFSDANGYLYLLLIFTIPAILNKISNIQLLYNSLIAGVTYLSFKTLLLLYFFSHGFQTLNKYLYLWIRDMRIGEITLVSQDYSFQRIFMQSQIYELLALFIISFLIYDKIIKKEKLKTLISLFILFFSTIIISFSRSFWLGLIFGVFIFIIYLIKELIIKSIDFKKLFFTITIFIFSIITSIVLIIGLLKFPIPTPGAFNFNLLTNRATSISGEAAVSSRWNLLPPLTKKIKESILLGSGFGTTVTYNSNDPRIKNESNPTGKYTTSSFEWGFLDLVTEVGVIGAVIYLIFYFKLLHKTYNQSKSTQPKEKYILLGITTGLLSLFIVNFFTPYLNHPLGIGFLVFAYFIYCVNNANSFSNTR